MATVLDFETRLSESKIWQFEKEYYDSLGVEAWLSQVPFYISSNVYFATHYTQLIMAYIQDGLANKRIRASHPIYIFELGTGPGKFSFIMLNLIKHYKELYQLEKLDICYVMTDFTNSNINYWENHVQFQPFIQDRSLDFACFDATNPMPLDLRNREIRLSYNRSKNPVITLSNYLFDTIPHDIFKVEDGKLYMGAITTKTTPDNIDEQGKIKVLEQLETEFTYQPIDTPPYDNKALNKVVQQYQAQLKNGTFTIPIGAITGLDYLKTLSKEGALCLASDKGYASDKEFHLLQDTSIDYTGSFSFMVNFDALAKYMRQNKGDALIHETQDNRYSFFTTLFQTRGNFGDYKHLNVCFQDTIGTCTTEDFLSITEAGKDTQELHQIIAFLRFSKWDPDVLYQAVPTLLEQIENKPSHYYAILEEGIDQASQFSYQFEADKDYFFEWGRLYYTIGAHKKALNAYKTSLDILQHPTAQLYFNMALSYFYDNNKNMALEYFKCALEEDPTYKPAAEWIEKI